MNERDRIGIMQTDYEIYKILKKYEKSYENCRLKWDTLVIKLR